MSTHTQSALLDEIALERYRHAVMMRGRAAERFRTARHEIDAGEARHALQHWTQEVQSALEALPQSLRTQPTEAQS